MDRNWETIEFWMEQYGDKLVRTVAVMTGDREEAQDIAQEVFIRAYRGIRSFRREASPYTYLCSIAINLVRSHRRRNARRPKEVEFDDRFAKGSYLTPEAGVLKAEQHELITRGVRSLSAKLREAVSLFYLSGMSIEDMAETLGISKGTVKSRLFRAREDLKQFITEEADYGAV